jgi:hypothetical protein
MSRPASRARLVATTTSQTATTTERTHPHAQSALRCRAEETLSPLSRRSAWRIVAAVVRCASGRVRLAGVSTDATTMMRTGSRHA